MPKLAGNGVWTGRWEIFRRSLAVYMWVWVWVCLYVHLWMVWADVIVVDKVTLRCV